MKSTSVGHCQRSKCSLFLHYTYYGGGLAQWGCTSDS